MMQKKHKSPVLLVMLGIITAAIAFLIVGLAMHAQIDGAVAQDSAAEVMRLSMVGNGRILTGVFILLFGILMALIIMPMRLGKTIEKQDHTTGGE